jgi:hypothetical protein
MRVNDQETEISMSNPILASAEIIQPDGQHVDENLRQKARERLIVRTFLR